MRNCRSRSNPCPEMVLGRRRASAVSSGHGSVCDFRPPTFFGSLYFHTRPSVVLLLQMILIAGFTQCLIHYTGMPPVLPPVVRPMKPVGFLKKSRAGSGDLGGG
jgi:hypothetical protein